MGEYDRKQRKQESRAIAYNGGGSRQLKRFGDSKVVDNGLNKMGQDISTLNITTIQRAQEEYLYGAANETPHISQYPGGCHLKVAGGARYNLVKNDFRVKQGEIDSAFDAVKADYPIPSNPTRIALFDIMRAVLRGARIRPGNEKIK